MDTNESSKTKALIIGAVIGALSGVGAAYLFLQRAQQEENAPSLTAGDGVKIGLGLLTLMRLIADIGGGK